MIKIGQRNSISSSMSRRTSICTESGHFILPAMQERCLHYVAEKTSMIAVCGGEALELC